MVRVRTKPSSFGEVRVGKLGVRMASSPREIDAAQALRYRVFYDEMGAEASSESARRQRDADAWDEVADHLLVIDHDLGNDINAVVGTYRLIRSDAASEIGRFYSEDEYDLGPILSFPGSVLELGRSCVEASHRGRAVMQLLWRGIAAYVDLHGIELMFGCASLNGIDPDALAVELTYLYGHHLAPPALRPRAVSARYIEMRRLDPATLDPRKANQMLPPLIKGYLRLGGFVGDGAVIDHQFNTVDVAIVVKTDLITERYSKHYGRNQE